MKAITIFTAIILLIVAVAATVSKYNVSKNIEDYQRNSDSLRLIIAKEHIFADTFGIASGPLKIDSTAIYESYPNNYKDVYIIAHNMGSKKIVAVRLKVYCENAFGEPDKTTLSSIEDGCFLGEFEDDIEGQKIEVIRFREVAKKAKYAYAWPTEVAFEDGTQWKSQKKSN